MVAASAATTRPASPAQWVRTRMPRPPVPEHLQTFQVPVLENHHRRGEITLPVPHRRHVVEPLARSRCRTGPGRGPGRLQSRTATSVAERTSMISGCVTGRPRNASPRAAWSTNSPAISSTMRARHGLLHQRVRRIGRIPELDTGVPVRLVPGDHVRGDRRRHAPERRLDAQRRDRPTITRRASRRPSTRSWRCRPGDARTCSR